MRKGPDDETVDCKGQYKGEASETGCLPGGRAAKPYFVIIHFGLTNVGIIVCEEAPFLRALWSTLVI